MSRILFTSCEPHVISRTPCACEYTYANESPTLQQQTTDLPAYRGSPSGKITATVNVVRAPPLSKIACCADEKLRSRLMKISRVDLAMLPVIWPNTARSK